METQGISKQIFRLVWVLGSGVTMETFSVGGVGGETRAFTYHPLTLPRCKRMICLVPSSIFAYRLNVYPRGTSFLRQRSFLKRVYIYVWCVAVVAFSVGSVGRKASAFIDAHCHTQIGLRVNPRTIETQTVRIQRGHGHTRTGN